MILSAICAALWAGGCAYADDVSRPAALLVQQCQALLLDCTIAAQLRELQRYPLCSLETGQPVAVAELLARMAEGASQLVITYMNGIFNAEMCLRTQIDIVAGSQQQLLALSAAVTRPALMHSSATEPPGSVQQLVPAAYKGAALLANVAMISTAALDEHPSSICQPAALAATVASGAVAVLVFAPLDSSSGRRPLNIERNMPGCMQYTAHATRFLHVLAQQLCKKNRANAQAARFALVTEEVAQSLVKLLLWLSEPTTAVAIASGVLAEALPALRLMAGDEGMRQVLAAENGAHAWEPVSAALWRRLPRRLAARLMPDLDSISAAVAGSSALAAGSVPVDAAAVAAADAAMAELLQVQPASWCWDWQTDATEPLLWCNCSVFRQHFDCWLLSEKFDKDSELFLMLYYFGMHWNYNHWSFSLADVWMDPLITVFATAGGNVGGRKHSWPGQQWWQEAQWQSWEEGRQEMICWAHAELSRACLSCLLS